MRKWIVSEKDKWTYVQYVRCSTTRRKEAYAVNVGVWKQKKYQLTSIQFNCKFCLPEQNCSTLHSLVCFIISAFFLIQAFKNPVMSDIDPITVRFYRQEAVESESPRQSQTDLEILWNCQCSHQYAVTFGMSTSLTPTSIPQRWTGALIDNGFKIDSH